MSRPRLLDLFCGGGGCSVGYHRAGFDVTGVDIEAHPEYPFEMVVADAMGVLADGEYLRSFDAVHASPPCPRYSTITSEERRDEHPDLVPPVLAAFEESGMPWVIENVPGAPLPGGRTVMICGRAMGLRWFRRHRLFASSVPLMSPGCACGSERPWMVTGDHPDAREYLRPDGGTRGRKAQPVEHAQDVMGIDWMTRWDDLTDAIPPVYTEYVGSQLLDFVTPRVRTGTRRDASLVRG